jgi:hypothetical protein
MSVTFSTSSRCAIPVLILLACSAVPANADSGTVVPLRSILRACDFSQIPDRSSQDDGTASAIIHATGGTVTADIHFAEPSAPGAHYDVSLIQAPRASNTSCDVAGPGVAVASLDTDGVGQGSTTVRDGIRSGTTGVWLFIRQPSLKSQSPAEFYTSDFLAKV